MTPAAHSPVRSAIETGFMSGFGNGLETEALPFALPLGRNSPSAGPTAFTPSSCPALHSRRRASPTSARGSTASIPRWRTGRGRMARQLRPYKYDPWLGLHPAGAWADRGQLPRGGFVPGGAPLHNTMLPHGPDVDAFEKGCNAGLKPHKLEGTMAFMFETRFPQRVTRYAAECGALQTDYATYGRKLIKRVDPSKP